MISHLESVINSSHNGRELELMLSGKKPFSVFMRMTADNFDEFGGQDFARPVKDGKILRKIFFVKMLKCNAKAIYTGFYLYGEDWRFYAYKNLIKSLQENWSIDQEIIASILLGYNLSEVASYIEAYNG